MGSSDSIAAEDGASVGGLLPGGGSVVAAMLVVVISIRRKAEHPRAQRVMPCRIMAGMHRASILVPQVFLYKGEPYCRCFLVDNSHGSEIVLKSDSKKLQPKTSVEKPTKTSDKGQIQANSGKKSPYPSNLLKSLIK